jgi:hypothetical protein
MMGGNAYGFILAQKYFKFMVEDPRTNIKGAPTDFVELSKNVFEMYSYLSYGIYMVLFGDAEEREAGKKLISSAISEFENRVEELISNPVPSAAFAKNDMMGTLIYKGGSGGYGMDETEAETARALLGASSADLVGLYEVASTMLTAGDPLQHFVDTAVVAASTPLLTFFLGLPYITPTTLQNLSKAVGVKLTLASRKGMRNTREAFEQLKKEISF